MIQKVYEIDPLKCPKSGEQMRIISFIEQRDQPEVVKKILKHCNLWTEPVSRAPTPVHSRTRIYPNGRVSY